MLEDIELVEQQLTVADYVIDDLVAVERKTGRDFAASIKDGRLFDQAQRIKEAYPKSLLILEGEIFLKENVVMGTLLSLAKRGLPVIRTKDAQATANALLLLEKKKGKATHAKPKGIKAPGRPLREISIDSLASMPGVSKTNALKILKHFSSLQAVASASQEELQEIEGVGAKLSESLYKAFNEAL